MSSYISSCCIYTLHQVPQQKNDYDCGLFVLYFIERFMEEAPERLKMKDLDMVIAVCFFVKTISFQIMSFVDWYLSTYSLEGDGSNLKRRPIWEWKSVSCL